MKKRNLLFLVLGMACLFALLFKEKSIGLNLFIFEIIAIPLMIYLFRPVKINYLFITLFSALIISMGLVLLLNTAWVNFVNILLMLSFSGMVMFPNSRSYFHLLIESVVRFFKAQAAPFVKTFDGETKKHLVLKKVLYYVMIPLAVLLVFILIYAAASSAFYQHFEIVVKAIYDFFEMIDMTFVWYVILGLILCNAMFMKTKQVGLYQTDLQSNTALNRIRIKHFLPFKFTGLKLQATSGVILLIALNILIFYFNILDIVKVWFGFHWDGNYLREFVHEGTWMLVMSVFISGAIALFFFRKNLNFYSKNLWLKRLTILWIAQNLLMTFSVMIRNYWYMNYFGLAYKRIAVFFFLLLTVIGLVTIIIKIMKRKSSYFLWKVNSFAFLSVLIISMFFNWDVIIAKHNFKHYQQSFIEYGFMVRLNNNTIPYTFKSLEELKKINETQEKNIPFDIEQPYYLTYQEYYERMCDKKINFIKRYKAQNWLEWNLADYLTYKKLCQQ